MRRPLAAGNWKMNGGAPALSEIRSLLEVAGTASSEILICPPATLIDRMRALIAQAPIAVGGQDCHPSESGAHTGDLSAEMLADAGASYVILGHSERRQDHGQDDALVQAKILAARRAGLSAICCVGESLAEREAGQTLDIVSAQIRGSVPQDDSPGLVIAYEPIWAIGTGLTPSAEEIAEVHGALRSMLSAHLGSARAETVRLLYGGSVKPANAAEIFAIDTVDGALVGGASLKADDFSQIIAALDAAQG